MRVAAVVALILFATPAAADPSVDEAVRAFGLVGTWAIDCKQPASPSNTYVRVTTPSPGLVVEEHDLGPDSVVNRYSILSAQQLSDSQIALNVIFQPGREGEERQRLVLTVRDNTRRTMFNQPEGGKVRVENGIVLAFGVKTPLLHKCE